MKIKSQYLQVFFRCFFLFAKITPVFFLVTSCNLGNTTKNTNEVIRVEQVKERESTDNLKKLYSLCIWHLKSTEGIRLKAYKCKAGFSTIGYGHAINYEHEKRYLHQIITLKEADYILTKDFLKLYQEVGEKYPHLDNRMNRYAITLLAFNIGLNAIKGTKLEEYIISKNWDKAASQILKFNKAKVKGELTALEGLNKKRKFESMLLQGRFKELEKTKKHLKEIVQKKRNEEYNRVFSI